jgi:hypothetical protein
MDTRRFLPQPVSICLFIILVGLGSPLLSACGQAKTPSPTLTQLPVSSPLPDLPTGTAPASLPPQPSATPACTDGLQFISDVTIPDNTVVAPGSSLDKQWLVQNNGTCNWDAGYRLRLVSGDPLGASAEQALFPARAGTQATLRILFTAPQQDGEFVSEWQGFDASGIPFGESFVIKIVVQQQQ